jgi:hypothetical protein
MKLKASKPSKTPKNRPFSSPLKRSHRMSFLLNDEEFKMLNHYLAKYKIENTSRFMRETLMRSMLNRLDKDRPTLFD